MSTHTGPEQVERALEPIEGTENIQADPTAPLMPFPTALRLTRDQEEELVTHFMTRKAELETEMGRDVVGVGEGRWWGGMSGGATPDPLGINGPQNTWMGKRILYDKTFKNEMGWRAAVLGGIFAKSNLCVTVARDICRKMSARAISYFFGTSPWFALYPVGIMDKQKAEKANRYTRWKLDKANLQEVKESGIEQAFAIGEAVIKSEWAQREQLYDTFATVLVDEQGNDILGADGDYILESDLWIQDAKEDPATGQLIVADLMVLKRDGKTPQPQNMIWQEKLITRRIVHYKGPEAELVNFLDFLCPLTAKSIQQADTVCHIYDMALMDLADQWKKSAAANATAEQRMEATIKATEALRLLEVGNHEVSAAQNSSAVDSSNDTNLTSAITQPIVNIAEFHGRYDIDGRGLRDIVLVVDVKSRVPIFYDYVANTTEDGLRPYSCFRPVKVKGRWYGMGALELMNPSQEILDLWFNRKNHAVSAGGRVDFWNPALTKEGASNPHLRLNWGGTYTPKDMQTDPKTILHSVYLEDNIGDGLMELMQFTMQVMMNGSGVTNANDGNVAGMDSTELATGIRNVEKSGQELFSVFISSLRPGIADALKKNVKILFGNLDKMEVYRYFEEGEAGGEGAGELQSIDPGEIANLEMDVEILLTRYQGEQILESYTRAWDVTDRFYQEQRPEVMARKAILARGILKALQISEADTIIAPIQVFVPSPMPGSGMDPNQMAAGAPTTPSITPPPNL